MSVIVKFDKSSEFRAFQRLIGEKEPLSMGWYIPFVYHSKIDRIYRGFQKNFAAQTAIDGGFFGSYVDCPVFLKIDVEKNKFKKVKETNNFICYGDFVLLKSVSK